MIPNLADTSFLFSLYGNDAHTARARAWVARQSRPVAITALSRYEFGNALRFAAFRKAISPGDAQTSLIAFETDVQTGYVSLVQCDLASVVDEARRLSERHTLTGGHRSFDILHVASAKTLEAKFFLSFDTSQRRLAAAERLAIAP